MEKRSSFSGRIGFVLAAAGSAGCVCAFAGCCAETSAVCGLLSLLAAGSAAPEAGATALLQPQRAMTAVVDMVNARIKNKCFPFIFESPFMICAAGRRSEKHFCGTDVPHRKGCGRSFSPCAGGA